MKAPLGFDASVRKSGRELPVIWDSERLVNPHILIAGMSGAGKTHTLRHMIASMFSSAVYMPRFHIFDVHGDIEVEGASVVEISERGKFGLNPLRVSPSPKYGGIRKQIQLFIDTINRVSSSPLGIKQVTVIRNLLQDVYAIHGFKNDDPDTWHINPGDEVLINGGTENRLYLRVPIAEKDEAKALGARWDVQKSLWYVFADKYEGSVTKWLPATVGRRNPTVEEVLIYAKRLHQRLFLGSDQKSVMKLEIFNKAAASYKRKVLEKFKQGENDWSDPALREALDKAGMKAVESYADYVESVQTGYELDHLLRYDSTEVLKSIVDRFETLIGTGLFKSTPISLPEENPVWNYTLDGLLRAEEKKMFVFFRLEEIWAEARIKGKTDHIRDVILLDEFGLYATEAQDPDHIINVLARESRKYGIALIVAGQDPDAFPDSLVGSIGTKMILGVDENYWRSMTNKMRIDEALLKWIKLQSTIAVQFKEKSVTKNEWRWVHLK